MSYILDALKKSEQERGRGSAPSVQTMHTIGHDSTSARTHYWPHVLLFAIFVNLGALLYFIITDTREQQPVSSPLAAVQTESTTIETTRAPAATMDTEPLLLAPVDEEILYRQVTMPAIVETAVRPGPQDVATTVAYAPPQASLLQRDELPETIQQQIPIMQFSAHVYSSNPLHRSIVINGRSMEEGDQLASDLTLSEITPKGAIFDFQGQLFHQNVVSAWN
jgi:general secretion pathway protein B